jgi:hypothetical protein
MNTVGSGELIDKEYCCSDADKLSLEQHVDHLVPTAAKDVLAVVSQWGLKEIWLGLLPREKHTRWHHTVGALTIALRWCSQLIHSSRYLGLNSDEGVRVLVSLAVALHDIGHLPFAHLVGEVLESINWVPPGEGLSGLEQQVLATRFDKNLKELWPEWGTRLQFPPDRLKEAITDLISGRHGLPWAQAIVNSAIDADKLDYVQRDSEFLRSHTNLVGGRLPPSGQKAQWLTEFLGGQTINHAGLLCLSGKSAVLAADLIRDRVFLYDRFYLSPEIRVADRMAFEIIQQFLIRAVMSEDFRKRISANGDGGHEHGQTLGASMERGGLDVRQQKCRLAAQILNSLAPTAGGSAMEFEILRLMHEQLSQEKRVDTGVQDLWKACFGRLEELKKKGKTLAALAPKLLVREPLVLRRRDYDRAMEIVRPLQHFYARDVLIDLAKLPRALGVGRRWRGQRGREVDCQILVPEGPVSRWGAGSKPCQPLTDEAVRELERPYARVIVVAPCESNVHCEYIWERVRAALLEGGVELVKKVRGT